MKALASLVVVIASQTGATPVVLQCGWEDGNSVIYRISDTQWQEWGAADGAWRDDLCIMLPLTRTGRCDHTPGRFRSVGADGGSLETLEIDRTTARITHSFRSPNVNNVLSGTCVQTVEPTPPRTRF